MLLAILAPYFTAGIVLSSGVATRSAPIIRYMLGWTEGRIRSYCSSKKWQVYSMD